MSDGAWVVWWNIGVVAGLVGLPAMLGFFAGSSIDAASRSVIPWRFLFAALGALVGAFAGWRMLMPRRARRGD